MLRQYVAPYRRYLGGSVLLNLLSVIFKVFWTEIGEDG